MFPIFILSLSVCFSLFIGGQQPLGKFSNAMDHIYESVIRETESKIVYGLGDNGEAVRLTGDEGREGDEVYKKKAFNLVVSNKVALNRTIKDARHPEYDFFIYLFYFYMV